MNRYIEECLWSSRKNIPEPKGAPMPFLLWLSDNVRNGPNLFEQVINNRDNLLYNFLTHDEVKNSQGSHDFGRSRFAATTSGGRSGKHVL